MAEPRAIVPEKGIRPGLNSTGSDIAKHVCVELAADGDPPTIALSSAGASIYGVVVASQVRVNVSPDVGIPDTEIGDIQVEGVAVVLAAGAIPVGSLVMVTAAGAVIVATATNTPVGKAVSTGVDTELLEVELAGPGVGGELNA